MNKIYSKFIVSILISLVPFLGFSQKIEVGAQKKADRLYASYNYESAEKIYQKLVQSNPKSVKNLERLADCYVKSNKYEDAEKVYQKLLSIDSNPRNLKAYASVLKSNAKYEDAKAKFQDYLLQTNDSLNIKNEILGCDSAIIWMEHPLKYDIKNQSAVNTSLSEFGPSRSGNNLFYVSEPAASLLKKEYERTGNSFLRINLATVDSNFQLINPKTDNSIYNLEKFHSGPIISNKARNKFYVTRNYEGKKGEISSEGSLRFRTNNLTLGIYSIKNSQLVEQSFPYNNIKNYSVGHAALSSDEKVLYFVSDKPGGFGGTDIWFSELQADSTWSKPLNAGAQINTPQNEMFPSIGQNDTLYFASNGHVGMGGLDIFKAFGERNNWTNPENLKYPINSSADDFSFLLEKSSLDTTIGYFASNRNGGIGSDDIYSFHDIKVKPLYFAIKGAIINKGTGLPLKDISVSLYANGVKIVDNASMSKDYQISLEPNTDYSIIAKKLKFLADSVSLTTKGLKESKIFSVDFKLDSLFEIGKIITIPNIYYDFDQDSIRTDAAKVLDGLVRTMLDNPTLEVELGSHTDSRGDAEYNQKLSLRRASYAVKYIVGKGIGIKRIKAKGYGESGLINKCSNGVECSDEEHEANRRTTFKILKY